MTLRVYSKLYKGMSWEMVKVKSKNIRFNLQCRRGHSSIFTRNRKLMFFGGIKGFNQFTNDLIEINLQVNYE